MQHYRRLLATPGIKSLLVLMFFARIPSTASGMAVTLHVAVGLGHSYGAAGLAGAVVTIGHAVGGPIAGRLVDRYGLRTLVLITTIGEALFWIVAPRVPYALLLALGFVGGMLILPAMSIGRQAIAALVPPESRRTAYSLDSISVELTYMFGPTLAVLLCTQAGTRAALTWLGITIVVLGAAVYLVNPAVRSEDEAPVGQARPPRKEWLTGRLIAVLLVGGAAVFVLAGMEVAIIADLRAYGELPLTGVVIAASCVASMVGGLVHGVVRRSLPSVVLLTLLSALCVPIGLAGDAWWILALAVLPMSLMCAPTLAATAESVSTLAPAAVRGEAMGLQSAALTLGGAAGTPVIGFVMDHSSPSWGYAAAGIGGLIIAAIAAVAVVRGRRTPETVAP